MGDFDSKAGLLDNSARSLTDGDGPVSSTGQPAGQATNKTSGAQPLASVQPPPSRQAAATRTQGPSKRSNAAAPTGENLLAMGRRGTPDRGAPSAPTGAAKTSKAGSSLGQYNPSISDQMATVRKIEQEKQKAEKAKGPPAPRPQPPRPGQSPLSTPRPTPTKRPKRKPIASPTDYGWDFQRNPITPQKEAARVIAKPTEDWSATDVQKAMASRDYFQANHTAAEDRDKLAKRVQSWHERIYNRPDAPETKGLNNLETRKAEDAFLNQLKGLFDQAAQGEGKAAEEALDLTGTIPEGAAVSAGSNDLAQPDQWTTEGFPNEPEQPHGVQAGSQEPEEPEKQPLRVLGDLPTQEQLGGMTNDSLKIAIDSWSLHEKDASDQLDQSSTALGLLQDELNANEFSTEGAAATAIKALLSGAGGFLSSGAPGAVRDTLTSLAEDGLQATQKAMKNGDTRELARQVAGLNQINRRVLKETQERKAVYMDALKQRSRSTVKSDSKAPSAGRKTIERSSP